MKIFQEIQDSVYNPSYYKSLPEGRTLRSSIKYLAKLSLLASLVGIVLFAFEAPQVSRNIKNFVASIVAGYPDDLVVSIKNGTASMNKTGPYLVPMAKSEQGDAMGNYTNLVVIHTEEPFSLGKFESYSTWALLGKTELATRRGSGEEIQILPLSTFDDREISKSWILEKEATILKLMPWIMISIVVLMYFVLFSMNFIGVLLMTILYAIFIWLMGKMANISLSYKNSYKIGIHGSTLLVLLGLLSPYAHVLNNFFFKIVVIILVVYANFIKGSSEAETAEYPDSTV